MAFKFLDRARESTGTVGTGNITFGGAISGYVAFSAGLSNGDTTPYAINDGANYEEGVLTYISASNTCSRAVSKSSNANAAISLSGSAVIFSTVRGADIGSGASNILQLDASGYNPVSGSWTKLNELTPSAVATADITYLSGFPANFDTFCLEWLQLVPATTDVRLGLRIGTGATPTWQATGYGWGFNWVSTGGGVNGQGSADANAVSDRIALTAGSTASFGVGNDAGCHASGKCFFRKPNGSSLYPLFKFQSAWLRPTPGSNGHAGADGAGFYTTAAAMTGLRLLFSSGNIASGTVRLWGIHS